jgi:hypothetical protein
MVSAKRSTANVAGARDPLRASASLASLREKRFHAKLAKYAKKPQRRSTEALLLEQCLVPFVAFVGKNKKSPASETAGRKGGNNDLAASDAVRVVLGVRVRAPGADHVDRKAKETYSSDPRNSRDYQPNYPDQYSAVIDLPEPGNEQT